MKIVVKHKCGHYQLHEIEANDDGEVATIYIKLSLQDCNDCKEKKDEEE